MGDKFNPGEFDTKVEVLRCDITTGDRGQKSCYYSHHSNIWAKVAQNIDETIDNGNLQQDVGLEITCYKIEGISSRWRMVYNGRSYDISNIDPISRISPYMRVSLHVVE